MKKSIFLFFAAILCAVNADARKIYLDTKKNWDQASAIFFVHSWGGDSDIQGKMERIGTTSIFQYEIGNNTSVLFTRQSSSDKIINFDSPWNKTGDISIGDKNYVRITEWGKGECGTWTVAGGDDTQILEKKWDTGETKNDMYIKEDGIFYLEKKNKQLTAHTLGYKVVYNHAWSESYGKNNNNNAELKITEKYNYNIKFTFNPSTKAVAATATKVEHYLTGNANLVGGEGWKANEVKMTYNTSANNGTYTHTFSNLAAHTIYEMKVTDGTWDNNWDYDDLKEVPQNVSTFSDSKNIAFYLSEAGNVTVTFDAKTGKIEMTGNFAKIVPTINLLGLNDNWETTAENKMNSKSEDVVSCKATLAAGTNQFKIYIQEFNKWYGNSAAIIRDNALVNKVLSEGGNNISIQADVDGEYEFIWNYETKELSVVYPNTTVEYEKIYFVNSDGWSKVYAHLWLENSEPVINNVAWPGTEITANKEGTVNGYDIHYVTFIKGAYDKCIFNGGGGDDKKTDNLAIMDDYKYFYQVTGSWYANPEDIEASTNKFILGEFNNWAKEHGEFLKEDENIYSLTIHIEADTYKFKVVDNAWLGNGGTMKRGDTSVTTGGWTFKSDDNSECKLVADIDGDYTFTWYSDTKKLTVTYPEIIIGDGDNSNVLNSLNGKTVDLTVTRSFASGKLYTLVLPFAMDNSTVINVFGANVELYDFTSLSENNGELILNFTEQATPEIAAGTPYLIKPATNANGFDLTGVTINTATTPVAQTYGTTTITMQPVLSATAEDKTNGTSQYWLAANNSLYNNVVSIKGLRVIFDVQTTKANVRARAAFNENIETGLDNNQLPISNIQKLIENGQLIIIREGVKYNVQGQKL